MATVHDEQFYSFERLNTSTDGPLLRSGVGGLIPVELPERTRDSTEDRDTTFNIVASQSIQRPHSYPIRLKDGSKQSANLDPWPADSRANASPCSDESEESIQSVQITGDIFSAPTRLKGIMDNLANVKGVGEYYSWRYPLPSLAPSPTSSRKSSGVDSLRVSSAPVSPLLRPVPIHMSSQPPEPMSECEEGIDSLPDFSNLPSNRWQSPPKVPRPQNHEPAQSSRSQRRSKYRVREAQGPSGSNLEAPIDLAAMRRQSAPSTSTLNPHAPPFMPRDLARPRAYSVPVDSESLRTGLNSSYTSEHRPTEPVMTLNPFHPYLGAVNNISTQRLASIRNDLSQLRQWSNQFGPPPLPRLEPGPPAVFLAPHSHSYTHLGQTPLSERPTYPSEGYPIHPPVAYPLFDPGYLPVAPIAYREQQMVNIGPRHLWHTGYVPAPSTIIHPTLLPSLGTNMVNSPFIELTPVELPESRFKSELDNYSAAGTPASSHVPSLEACSQAEATSSFRRRSSPALFERGKSSLTPITERSETTSTSSQRMDLSDDQGLEAHKTPKKKNRRNKKPSSNINARRRMLVPKGTN